MTDDRRDDRGMGPDRVRDVRESLILISQADDPRVSLQHNLRGGQK